MRQESLKIKILTENIAEQIQCYVCLIQVLQLTMFNLVGHESDIIIEGWMGFEIVRFDFILSSIGTA